MNKTNSYAGFALAILAVFPVYVSGQQQDEQIEEVVVTGRLQSTAGDIVAERMQRETVTDILGADQISRVGDSTVAAALRRVPGLTLVDGKYVYVRGLGERYSSTTLNQAIVPSPDLSRSVLPLDIFPASLVESVAVQKSYSADRPAAFGGGAINVRTTGIPDEGVFSFEIGSGFNTANSGDMLSYAGGDDDWLGEDDGTRALPNELDQALKTYGGSLSTRAILDHLQQSGAPNASVAEAQQINRELATELNRNVVPEEEDYQLPIDARVSLGNNFQIGNDWELGFLTGVSYANSWEETDNESSQYADPAELKEFEEKSTYNVNIVYNAGIGVSWADDHEIEYGRIFIRDTDDETSVVDTFNQNSLFSDGTSDRQYRTRYEMREMVIDQFSGVHRLGADTQDVLGYDLPDFLEELEAEWYYSNATSTTDIPNESSWSARAEFEPGTRNFQSQQVNSSVQAADHRFTELDDHVESYGWVARLPVYFDRWEVELSGGYDYVGKDRSYEQLQLGMGTVDADATPVLSGPLEDVFSDANILEPDNGFAINVSGSNAESYLSATMLDAVFGKLDLRYGSNWRFSAGLRSENYRQVGLLWDPLSYDGSQIDTSLQALQDSTFTDEQLYPSASLTYMRDDFWAADFQLRFGYGKTTVRPDLREIVPSTWMDPITDVSVTGNPDLIPTDIDNFDLRAEWFFDNRDSFTVSAFYKDIDNPIEIFEFSVNEVRPATRVVNAESAEVLGAEVEWLHSLERYGDFLAPFFVAGNITAMDTQLVVGPNAAQATNQERSLSNASDHVVNLQLGYDSMDGKHSATLAYNVFGERLNYAGRNGAPDAYEQPFHSLDLVYAFYPTDRITLKLKVQNMLDERLEIQRAGATVDSEEVGVSSSLAFQWNF